MHETPEDLVELQALLDRSYASAGAHLSEIHTPDRRLTAEQLSERLTGMSLLTLATVSSDGRPFTGAVDGIFHRGHFWFSSSATSLRARHLDRNPAASVTHVPGEHLGVTVHGRAERVDPADYPDTYLACLDEIYGPTWRQFMEGAAGWRLDPERMFTFHMSVEELEAAKQAMREGRVPGD